MWKRVSAALLLLFVVPVGAQPARVVKISDGDTVRVLTALCPPKKQCQPGQMNNVRIRLAEIDAPESSQPYGKAAKRTLQNWLQGPQVTLNVVSWDRYGRAVAHVHQQGRWLNADLVNAGAAWVYRKYNDTPGLLKLEGVARAQRRGLWSLAAPERIPPWEYRRQRHLRGQ